MLDDTYSTSNECLIETLPEYTVVTASKAVENDWFSVYDILGNDNNYWSRWLARRVDQEEPEGEAWVRFDFVDSKNFP